MGFINSISIYGGVWNEIWSAPRAVGSRNWQELDWYAGFVVGFAQYWKLQAGRLGFVFPSGGSLENYNFSLSYDDAHWGLLFPLNPSVKVLWTHQGGSAVVLGITPDGYRF